MRWVRQPTILRRLSSRIRGAIISSTSSQFSLLTAEAILLATANKLPSTSSGGDSGRPRLMRYFRPKGSCSICKGRSTFQLVQAAGLLCGSHSPRSVTRGGPHGRERKTRVTMIDQEVCSLGNGDSFLSDPPGVAVVVAARQELRTNSSPGDRGLQIVAGETFTFRA